MNPALLALLVRLVAGLAAAGVIAAGFATVRSHWIHLGEATVQAAWNKQKDQERIQQLQKDREAAAKALQLQQQTAAEQAVQNRNAERIADEDHRREQAQAARLADALRTVDGLRDAIAKLDADDLSAAAADPRVAAIAGRAAAARGLLARCAAQYTNLAGRAVRLRDQVAGLQAFALNVCHAGADPDTNEEPHKETP